MNAVGSTNQPTIVKVNCRVTIRGFKPDDEEETFWIVPDSQSNLQENKLPTTSPLAIALTQIIHKAACPVLAGVGESEGRAETE